MVDNTIIHFDIPANDLEKLKAFYSKLFDWKIFRAPGPVDYWMIQTVPVDEQGMTLRPGVNGGMYKKEESDLKAINYIQVDDIDESIKKIVNLGGKITRQKQEVPGVGYIASAVDPEGNPFAVLQSMR
ncbi:MAG: VOC family protein [Candidatus Bathyarchaeota archaeon]|nr:VOC family protein [Candidatus Bathyarchaeum sp.]